MTSVKRVDLKEVLMLWYVHTTYGVLQSRFFVCAFLSQHMSKQFDRKAQIFIFVAKSSYLLPRTESDKVYIVDLVGDHDAVIATGLCLKLAKTDRGHEILARKLKFRAS